MRRVAVVFVVAVLAALPVARSAAADGRFHGNGSGRQVASGRSFHANGQFVHNHAPFRHDGFGRHRFVPRHFGGFGVVVAPPVVVYSPFAFDASPPYSPPSYYSSAPVYAPPAVYAPPSFSQPAPAPPLPRVVEYPTGRYELRGDGISTPYTWVWIPNPPPPPPMAPPMSPPAGAPTSGDATPTRQTQIYQWVDERGVVHWTNRLQTVPLRYREEAKRLEPS
jgi:hypothetical protein